MSGTPPAPKLSDFPVERWATTICKFLSLRDLIVVQGVSCAFRDAVTVELMKRAKLALTKALM
jgi:hypothetical protein